MKNLLYDTAVSSETDEVEPISIAAAAIHETLGVIEHVGKNMSRWCRVCILTNGRNFERLL